MYKPSYNACILNWKRHKPSYTEYCFSRTGLAKKNACLHGIFTIGFHLQKHLEIIDSINTIVIGIFFFSKNRLNRNNINNKQKETSFVDLFSILHEEKQNQVILACYCYKRNRKFNAYKSKKGSLMS